MHTIAVSMSVKGGCIPVLNTACDNSFDKIGSEQLPKSTIAAFGKMPVSEGKHGQTAQHTQGTLCII